MIFLRFASQIIFIKCNQEAEIEQFLVENMKGIIEDYENAVKSGDEASTVVFLKDKGEVNNNLENENVILLNRDVKFVMKELINWDDKKYVEKLDMAPSMILMRYIDDWEKAYREMEERYKAERVNLFDAIKMDSEACTIIALTQKPLSMNISPFEIVNPPIVVNTPSDKLFKDLRSDVLIYLTKTAENREWYELNIAIYSKKGDYKRHYERVVHILNDLGIGMILHEGWTLDHPFVLVTVAVYQVTFLSLEDPIEVKKLLLGMEYNRNGERIVDLDLYHKKKKISWTKRGIKEFGKDRAEVGMHFRGELIKKLPGVTINKYLDVL